jgi:hypothetical protein
MEPEGSLPHSQVPATSPYPEPAQFSPYPTSCLLKIHLNTLFHLRLGLPSGLFPSGFPTKTLYISLPSTPQPSYMPLLSHSRFIIHVIVGEQYKSLSSSLRSFLHSPVTSSVLDPNILLSCQCICTIRRITQVHRQFTAQRNGFNQIQINTLFLNTLSKEL